MIQELFRWGPAGKMAFASRADVKRHHRTSGSPLDFIASNSFSNRWTTAASLAERKYEHADALLREAMPLPGDPIDHRRFEWYNTWLSSRTDWDLVRKEKLHSFRVAAKPKRLIISDDGSILATRCGNEVIVYRVADGRAALLTLTVTLSNEDFDLARRGRFLAIRDRKAIEIWTIPEKGQPEARLTIPAFNQWVSALALSRDERRLVAVGDYGRIRVWNVQDGKLLNDIDQYVENGKGRPQREIRSIAISPNGDWIAFCDIFRPVLYNLATKAEVKIDVPPGEYPHIEFTDAGNICIRTSEAVWSWPMWLPDGFTAGAGAKTAHR